MTTFVAAALAITVPTMVLGWLGLVTIRTRPARRIPASLVRSVVHQTLTGRGDTVNIITGERPVTGYAYGLGGTYMPREAFNRDAVHAFIAEHWPTLTLPGNYLGTWLDGDTVHLDVSRVESDLGTALREAQRLGEYAVYALPNGPDVFVPGAGDRVRP
jgi:hypothetical protein